MMDNYVFKVAMSGSKEHLAKTQVMNCLVGMGGQDYVSSCRVDLRRYDIIIGDSVCHLELVNTAGLERFSTVAPQHYRGASIAVIVIDTISTTSLSDALEAAMEINRYAGSDTKIGLIVWDTSNDSNDEKLVRCVSDESIKLFLAKLNDQLNIEQMITVNAKASGASQELSIFFTGLTKAVLDSSSNQRFNRSRPPESMNADPAYTR